MLEQLKIWVDRYAATPPATRYAVVLGLVSAMVAAYYFTEYGSQQSAIASYETQLAQKQGMKNEKENIAQNRSTYETKLGLLQTQLDEARSKLPDSADVPQLLAQLGSRARQTGLDIDQFEPRDEVKKSFYAEIPFQMKVRGSYHEVAMFIDSVGKLNRIINVTNIKMEDPKTEESRVIVSTSFDVKTYRFTEDGGDK